jgi:hypothetical protein
MQVYFFLHDSTSKYATCSNNCQSAQYVKKWRNSHQNYVWNLETGAFNDLSVLFYSISQFTFRVHSSPMWREWMREKHAERQAPYLDSGITIAKAREDLFRTELNSLYIEFPALAPERHAKPM